MIMKWMGSLSYNLQHATSHKSESKTISYYTTLLRDQPYQILDDAGTYDICTKKTSNEYEVYVWRASKIIYSMTSENPSYQKCGVSCCHHCVWDKAYISVGLHPYDYDR
jgi:hypothetical protein